MLCGSERMGLQPTLSWILVLLLLALRSDTFKVIGQAEGMAGAVACELLVQRVAEGHPFGPMGRRFRIISVRFRNL
jgi:hypothetical protein